MNLFGKKSQIIDLFSQIESCLVENSRLLYPTCYFRTDLFQTQDLQSLLLKLHEIVKKHKGQIASSVEDADHIIYPPSFEESLDTSNNNNHWVRVIKKRGKDSILIHRLFTPDSHDEWLSVEIDDEAAGLNDSVNNTSGGDVWEVTANWLLDTDIFNEWMNQEDYEVDSEQTLLINDGKIRLKKPPKMRRTLTDIIKKNVKSQSHVPRSPSPAPPSNKKLKTSANRKRKHEEISSIGSSLNLNLKENCDSNDADLTKNLDAPQPQPHVEEVHIPKNLHVKKETTDYQPYKNGTLIDLDEESPHNNNNNNNEENKDPNLQNTANHLLSNGANASNIPFNNNTNSLNSNNMLNGSDKEQQEACEQTHHIIVPSYAAWFDYSCIHEIEKRALPEFFNQKINQKLQKFSWAIEIL